ncbi:Hypothetical predicted protein [Cloeon dipterum]|nr:Hypothetical predicted protein [Cloeon dipterum]
MRSGKCIAANRKSERTCVSSDAAPSRRRLAMTSAAEQGYLKPEEAAEKSPMQQFYADKSIFLTGGTGFMGKVISEKLLRTCPDIRTIYLLIRPKKGKEISARFEEIFSDPVFAQLQEKNPKFASCVVPVAGDVAQKGLGLSEEDRQTLIENVNIVFHAAATVRFDEKLRLANAINVQGTKDMLALCALMKNLNAVIHVSTAYSNCNLREIKEKFYEPPISHEKLTQCVEALDDNLLDGSTPVLLQDFPNTYAFTKNVAEDVVKDLGRDLPIAVYRPAIIIATWKEPVSGWIDNVYGPTGVVVGAGLGILRTLQADKEMVADLVPVDMAVSALIATAYDTAVSARKAGDEIPIYNYVSSPEKPITWGEFMELNYKNGVNIPSMKAIWYYTLTINKFRSLHLLCSLFLHFLPALLVDGVLMVIGRQPQMMKVYKKIHRFGDVIAYFSTQQWNFSNQNMQSLWSRMHPKDQYLFNFSMKNMDWEDYFRTHILGLRKYLAKDDPSTLPAARKRWFKFLVVHRCIQGVAMYVAVRILWSLLSYIFLPAAATISIFLHTSSATAATAILRNRRNPVSTPGKFPKGERESLGGKRKPLLVPSVTEADEDVRKGPAWKIGKISIEKTRKSAASAEKRGGGGSYKCGQVGVRINLSTLSLRSHLDQRAVRDVAEFPSGQTLAPSRLKRRTTRGEGYFPFAMEIVNTKPLTYFGDDDLTPVQQFYHEKSVLITGASGFMGKVLLEKLLRSCPGVGNVYILLRPKRGEQPLQRLEKLMKDPVFERLRRERGSLIGATPGVVPITGDISRPGLGISAADRAVLVSSVEIVFHVAATVRFNEKMRQALQTNLGGTNAVMQLCKEMHQLKSFVYVSTAYTNSPRDKVDEVVYTPPVDPDKILQCMEWMSEEQFEDLAPS